MDGADWGCGMNNEQLIQGLTAISGQTEVFVAPLDGGWAIRLVTGEHETKFSISAETLECLMSLLMKQGGFVLPGVGVRLVCASALEKAYA